MAQSTTKPNKGGRPLEGNEPKNAPIAVRTTATLKTTLQEAAQREGRSITQEIERRLARSIEDDALFGDDAQAELLRKIVADIREMERLTKKRWHKDYTTWAAVAEAIANGAIMDMRPLHETDTELQDEAWDAVWEIIEAKRPLVSQLRAFGIAARIDAANINPGERVNALLGKTPHRMSEHIAITKLEADEDTKAKLYDLLEQIVALDDKEVEARTAFKEVLRPYHDAEAKGRSLYLEHRARRREMRAEMERTQPEKSE